MLPSGREKTLVGSVFGHVDNSEEQRTLHIFSLHPKYTSVLFWFCKLFPSESRVFWRRGFRQTCVTCIVDLQIDRYIFNMIFLHCKKCGRQYLQYLLINAVYAGPDIYLGRLKSNSRPASIYALMPAHSGMVELRIKKSATTSVSDGNLPNIWSRDYYLRWLRYLGCRMILG